VPVRDAGATYTGNMKSAFLSCGFADVSAYVNLANGAGMNPGDVLLNEQNHTAMFIGNGQLVHARSSEGNSIPGDQSGNEIRVQRYYNYPWDCVLRYGGDDAEPEPERELYAVVVQLPELRRGDMGYYVQEMQSQLVLHKCAPENTIRRDGTCDGEFGDGTEAALRRFQSMRQLPVTGVCDGQTWTELINK
jgi:peptidoglycan hydrolase-like protein with peptidoglycan-binding domain